MSTLFKGRLFFLPLVFVFVFQRVSSQFNYKDALMKSILFFEGQRSGPLNLKTLRNTWRGSSGLRDGYDQNVDLTGGYYDAGDNVKFNFPMSYSMTMLSWSIIEYESQLSSAGQLGYAREALRWGTDYLLKCHTAPNVFWGQVGLGNNDHTCWQRPEDMDTLRTAFKVDSSVPGTELSAEAAAALAAASIVFKTADSSYSKYLLKHSRQLFTFADKYRGTYTRGINNATTFYNSWSGFSDELAWASTWLYKATGEAFFLTYLVSKDPSLGLGSIVMNEFSWDNKYAGAQVLLSKLFLTRGGQFDGKTQNFLRNMKGKADYFACSNLPKTKTVRYTPQGLLYFRGVNFQYVVNSAFLITVYSDYLKQSSQNLNCGGASYNALEMLRFSKRQVDYMLGDNNAKFSYMVGFGSKYPKKIHHRGASVPSIRKYPSKISCGQSFSWLYTPNPDANVHIGAIVGGPDGNDNYPNDRNDYSTAEPTTYINAAAVGVLAKLYGLNSKNPTPTPVSSRPSPKAPLNRSPPRRSPPGRSPPVKSPPGRSPPRRSPPLRSPPKFPSPKPPTRSPPTQANNQVRITQKFLNSWVINGRTIVQYDVVISYDGPGEIKDIVLSISGQLFGFWGIVSTASGNYATLPWSPITSSQPYTKFGYQAYDGMVTVRIVSYNK